MFVSSACIILSWTTFYEQADTLACMADIMTGMQPDRAEMARDSRDFFNMHRAEHHSTDCQDVVYNSICDPLPWNES